MKDSECIQFLQWALPQLRMRWPGFRKVRKQVCKRIDRRLRELGLASLDDYRSFLEAHGEEWSTLDSYCRISISRFYRDRGVFDHLRLEVLPELASRIVASHDRTLRCWSAGCASGEEAYTLNMIWKLCISAHFPDVTLRIVATDNNPHMLDRVHQGCYPASSLKDFPQHLRGVAFQQRDGLFFMKPMFRENLELRLEDIRYGLPPERFHLLLCRHVAFTYFDEPLQSKMLERLISKLMPGGFLVTGKQESLPPLPAGLKEVRPRLGIYQQCGACFHPDAPSRWTALNRDAT